MIQFILIAGIFTWRLFSLMFRAAWTIGMVWLIGHYFFWGVI